MRCCRFGCFLGDFLFELLGYRGLGWHDEFFDEEELKTQALEAVEQHGIVFLDELDKVAGREGGHGPDVSREGVQRDLLPIVEGTLVHTKHGMVRTDHILFIAAGAFHVSKPADLIPELQGRFPIRVELDALSREDLVRILTEPENSLVRQYKALLGTEGLTLEFTGDGIEAFPEDQVVGLFLSAGVATAEALAQEGPDSVTIPSGTRLVIRTTDNIDSSRHSAGHRFRGQLESAVVVNGVTVLPRGALVHGQVMAAQQSGRAVGSSSLSLAFTDVMIDDVLHPISTEGMNAQTGGEGGRTLGRTARAAAIGGLASGSSGARTGARIGAGASILTSGASINVPRGTIVETSLRVALVLPM